MPKLEQTATELEGILTVARLMAVAARTAPKTRGEDSIETLIVYGDELEILAEAMEKHGEDSNIIDSFLRNADEMRRTHAVLIIGLTDLGPKKMNKPLNCGACGHENCAGFLKAAKKNGRDFSGPVCAFQSMDLGIALASACAVASRHHVDNRMMYTIGAAAVKLGWLKSKIAIGVPLSATGKNIYFSPA